MPMKTEDLQKMVAEVVSKEFAERWEDSRKKADEAASQHAKGIQAGQAADKGSIQRGYTTIDYDDDSVDARARKAVRCLRYYIAANKSMKDARDIAINCKDKSVADAMDKALGQSTLAGGGALIPPEFSSAIIEALGAKAVVRKAGPMLLDLNGSLSIPYIDAASTAAYVGEGANITKSEPTLGQLQFSDHKLASLVPIGNDILRNGGAKADNAIKNDIIRSIARKEDVTLLRSVGSASEPKGMLYQVQAANTFAGNGTVNVANVTLDCAKMARLIEEANVDMDTPNWFMSPRSKWYLMGARDGNSNLVWAGEMGQGRFFGSPFSSTSQIPSNLGGGTNESEVYLANMGDCVLAENESLIMQVFDGGTYYDNSAMVSGISQDQTVIRTIAIHDFGCRARGFELSVLHTVKWGA